MEATKRCSMCGEVKPLTEFHRNRRRRDGLQNACKPCNIARNQRWYREHPDVRSRRMDEQERSARRRKHRLVWEYLCEHPCVDCGETDPIVLEFDHLRDKVANISKMASSKRPWSVILEEIAKCEVVCANCHRRRTVARLNSHRHQWRDERPGS
jgi:hypothetical protein